MKQVLPENTVQNFETRDRQAGLAELNFHYANTGRGTKMAGKLQFDPKCPSNFTTLIQLHAAARGKMAAELKALLEAKDAYNLHRPVRKRFSRNTDTVTNIMDVWECGLFYLQGLIKYKDRMKHLLIVIGVLSKYLHVVPLK